MFERATGRTRLGSIVGREHDLGNGWILIRPTLHRSGRRELRIEGICESFGLKALVFGTLRSRKTELTTVAPIICIYCIYILLREPMLCSCLCHTRAERHFACIRIALPDASTMLQIWTDLYRPRSTTSKFELRVHLVCVPCHSVFQSVLVETLYQVGGHR